MTRTLPDRLSLLLLLLLSAAFLTALAPGVARSASVVNGDFETGDFTGWSLETDGSAGVAPDFTIVSAGGGSAARIEADYYATQGDVASPPQDGVFIANTLHQPLDLSVSSPMVVNLSFDWVFDGEDGSASAGDVFLIGLTDGSGQMYGADGQPGYVVSPTRTYGADSVSVSLNPLVFSNAPGWSLEVQILVGVDPAALQHNALGSYVEMDNIAVPEPGVLAGLASGFGLLFRLNRRRERRASRGRAATRALPLALLVGLIGATSVHAWTDFSSSTSFHTSPKALDRSANVLFSYAHVRNRSHSTLDTVRLVVTQPTVPVTNPDGFTAAAEPYFDLPTLDAQDSATVRIEFPLARVHVDYGLRLEALLTIPQSLEITTAPSLTMNPNGTTPLAAVITASTNKPTRATLTATSTSGSFMVEFDEYQIDHTLPLLGLKPDSSYSVITTFTDTEGKVRTSGSVAAVTGPLPADLTDIDILVNIPGLKEPGYTWLDGTPAIGSIVFDQNAEIVWYSSIPSGGTRKLENGNLFWQSGGTRVVEQDMLGNLVHEAFMQLPGLPESDLHHETYPTIYGTYLSLDREYVMVSGFPTSLTDPNAPTTTKQLRDEPIVEFLSDGTPLKRWPLIDIVDPTRIYWGILGNEPLDWAHANAVIHDPRDDSVIVSIRAQSVVCKVDRVTGELKWMLGNPSNWTPAFEALRLQPVGPIDWQYGQHAVMIMPNGHLMLFDNGNDRASPFDPFPQVPLADNYSRAVEFAIDEENMEVTQVWEWAGDYADRIFAGFLGDADYLPQTGNVLINFGGTSYMYGQSTTALGYGINVVRTIEVTHDTPPVVVLDIQVSDPVRRVTAYRAEHWESLYPPNATRTDF